MCSIVVSQAQNCKEDFIRNIEKAYEKSKKKHSKIVKRSINIAIQTRLLESDDFTIINIPEIEGKTPQGININKGNFFCYLYDKKMEFENAIVMKDSMVLGVIIPCSRAYCKYEFKKNIHYINAYTPPSLAKKIMEIKPDIIFSIYHISNAYWYIKNGDLKVLSFKDKEGEITGFTIYNPEEYLSSIPEERLNGFLKKVRLVFY